MREEIESMLFVSYVAETSKAKEWFSKLRGKKVCCLRCGLAMQTNQPNGTHSNYWRNLAREVTAEISSTVNKQVETNLSISETKHPTTSGREQDVSSVGESTAYVDSSERATFHSDISDTDLTCTDSDTTRRGVEKVSYDTSFQLSSTWDPSSSWRQYPDLVESANIGKMAQELSKHQEEDVFKYYIDNENNLRPFQDSISPGSSSSNDSETEEIVSEREAWENWHRLSQNVENDTAKENVVIEDGWNEIDRWRPIVEELKVFHSDSKEGTSKEEDMKKNKLSERRERMAWQKWFSSQQYDLSPSLWQRYVNTDHGRHKDSPMYKEWLADIEQNSQEK